MLQWAHSLVLRAVDQGDTDPSPALDDLLATGLVARTESGGLEVTPAGRHALDIEESTGRVERFGWPIVGVIVLGFTGAQIVDWLT